MITGLEIGMLIAGIIALVSGKFKLTANCVAEGVAARLAGLICLLPLPLSFAVGFVIALQQQAQGRPFDVKEMQLSLALLEGGIALACLILTIVVVLASGK